MRLQRILYSLTLPVLFGLAGSPLYGQKCTAGQVCITLSTSANNLQANQTATLQALVTGASDKSVAWSQNPNLGGFVIGKATYDSSTGISTNQYQAPASVTNGQTITVTATANADQTKTASVTITLGVQNDVGTGAPTPALIQAFFSAFFRNGFNNLVLLPPLGPVRKLGATGYVQEFNDLAKSAKLALATDAAAVNVYQIYGDVYSYYSTVGVTTAGYPTSDTLTCPFFDPANSCTYQFFDKRYELFAYKNPLVTGQDFTISGGFYTEWANQGGLGGVGRPLDAAVDITAGTNTTATVQTFSAGAIYTINSGPNKGKVFGVLEPVYDQYVAEGGSSSRFGLPTSEVFILASGVHRQTFEGGAIDFTPGGGGTVRLPVASVTLTGTQSSSVTLNLGQTVTLTAAVAASSGPALTDRAVSWSTTNSKVISIQANGQTAVLTAVGGGTASVLAASEGVSSAKINFIVIAPCCQIGDGAPPAVVQSFQDALARNHIAARVPVETPAVRVGSGYAQTVQSLAGNAPAVYLLAQSDRQGAAYVVGGATLAAYQALGGPAGTVGYPSSDLSTGGTQLFENGAALGGNPVRLVSGLILTKWALLKYDAGVAGVPVSDSAPFSTFQASSGVMQAFASGMILGATAGARAGQTYFVSGLILARYSALGGASGDFGMPTSDEFVTGSVHQQNFEGGSITYSAGDAAAQEHPSAKIPGVMIAPASITAGGRVRAAIVGFANNSTLRVSVTGEPDFLVTSANGAYSWDMFIPLNARSGTIAIHAADTNGPSAADGSLTVRGLADNRVQVAKTQGDNQTGAPGALLPLSLRIVLRDSSGNPVSGAPVVFQASAAAQLSAASAVTDNAGQAETWVRLPAAEGLILVNADAPGVTQSPVTFYARAAASGLSNFPQLQQAGSTPLGNGAASIAQKGALLTAAAAILRYHQNRGELPAPNGSADPATLNQFLRTFCTVDANGNQLFDGFLSNPDSREQIVNLWRAVSFTGGADVAVESPDPQTIADRVAEGSPVLVSLGLSLNGTPMGGHFVVATGITADGGILIEDPNPYFARASLNDYRNGFTTAAGPWKGDLRGAVRFVLSTPGARRFLVSALSETPALMTALALDVRSSAGVCGRLLELWDAVDASGSAPAAGALVSRMNICDGARSVYEITVGAAQSFHAFLTDLASGGASTDLSGSAPATYKATRPRATLVVAPQDVSFTADGVVNAATFTSGIAPGGLAAVFGSGLAGGTAATTVDFDGTAARVLSASPFQINVEVPPGITPGNHTLRLQSPFGTAQQTVAVSPVAPAIFLVGNPSAGALVNQDGSLNGPFSPLPRGQVLLIYATGLGTVSSQGPFSVTDVPVTVVIGAAELPVSFSGLAPGFIGLYQVNVVIPAGIPPGLGNSLILKQGGQASNTVTVALQ